MAFLIILLLVASVFVAFRFTLSGKFEKKIEEKKVKAEKLKKKIRNIKKSK